MKNRYFDYSVSQEMHELFAEAYRNAHRVIVATDRNFNDKKHFDGKLNDLFWCSEVFNAEIKILSGVETDYAVQYVDEHELTRILYPANRKYHLKYAGVFRYNDMLEVATHVVIFTAGNDMDIQYLHEKAKERKIPVWTFKPEND